MSADSRWYVAHTYSGYEKKVATNIEKIAENRKMQDQILEVKIPVEIVEDSENKKEIERKLFPSYVFVKVAVSPDKDNRPAMSDEAWLLIRNARGVTGFVGPDGKAVPLSDEEAVKLGVEKRTVEVSYKVGDAVKIVDEIFDGFTGVVESLDAENNSVKVSVSALFGKRTTVELELDQVELV